ncbi:SPOR domain-containing protein [Undibacterium cyanobacteriorum]|uniref:SPOR domain-containing protein n=1 Tax=Undibacterium cyanobacteriorum TaxID=3073561 RepID=A0ABY9RJH4_9BURK|nr:SPOR domain-containing protein [Undibacterium sp. 20NA77.5]WMW81378.1 SPOR domain-containing protein [Undibacterium sp. 20NA77.5]
MLRFLLFTLLVINGLLLGFNLGIFDRLVDLKMEKHEPHRMKAEKNVDKLKLLSASAAQDLVEASAKKAEPPIACIEIGNFTLADAKNFEERLKHLSLGDRVGRQELSESASNMVYLPSQGNKDAADKKAIAIKKMGVSDAYVIQDGSALKWGVSLGVFKTMEAAKTHVANLAKKGIKDAKIAPRQVSATKMLYQMYEISPDEKKSIDQIREQFAGIEEHQCTSKLGAKTE